MDYQALRHINEIGNSTPVYLLIPAAAVVVYELFKNIQDHMRINREFGLEDKLD